MTAARETQPRVVSLWVDDSAVGCGERIFVVVSVGPHWATLLSPASLDKVQVDRRAFDLHARPVDDPKRWRAVGKRLALNAKTYKRMGLRHPAALVKRARALLLAERARGSNGARKAVQWLDALASAEVADDDALPVVAAAPKKAPEAAAPKGGYADILTAQGFVRDFRGEPKGWQQWRSGDDKCDVETRSGKWTLARKGRPQIAGRLTPSLAKVFVEESGER